MKRYCIYIIELLVIALFCSCEDQLNALPGQSKVDGNVIVDQETAEVALNGVYYMLAEVGSDRGTPSTMWGENHEVIPAILAGYITNAFGSNPLNENAQVTASDLRVRSFWTSIYKVINAANGVLKQIAPVSEDEFVHNRKTEIIAEARLLRAYGHFKALCYFAQFYDVKSPYGVLLREEFSTTTKMAKARSNVADSYSSILGDLDFAIQYAPLESENTSVNQWVAKGLKARVLMMRGGEGDYEEVIRLTSDIIDHSPYVLEENLRDIFQIKGLTSTEVMLGIVPMPNQTKHYTTYIYYEDPYYTPTRTDSLLYRDDPRIEWMLGEVAGMDGITKYVGSQQEISYAMRLSEMYLLQAEAIVRSGGSVDDARNILEEIMGHAGVTDFTTLESITDPNVMLTEVYEEIARNLMLEDGIEWNALTRLPIEKILEIKPAIMAKNYIILPIPAVEFERNPTIGDQNPGYSKN